MDTVLAADTELAADTLGVAVGAAVREAVPWEDTVQLAVTHMVDMIKGKDLLF